MKLPDGSWTWRKGGTQKGDGLFVLVRRHVSRRASKTSNRDEIREKSYFFQWIQWQSEDVESDAIRGIHSQAPTVDLLGALGKMRQRFRARVPDETLALHGESWFQEVMQTVYDDLPAAGLLPPPPQRRMRMKTRV